MARKLGCLLDTDSVGKGHKIHNKDGSTSCKVSITFKPAMLKKLRLEAQEKRRSIGHINRELVALGYKYRKLIDDGIIQPEVEGKKNGGF